MKWKDKLELKYETEEDVFLQRKTLTLFCSWRGFLLIRKQVAVKPKHFNYNRLKRLLHQWFNDYVLNYDDLTTRQKRRLADLPFVGTEEVPKGERYGRLYDYVDSEFLEYAKIKIILVRVNYSRGETGGYQVRPKTVIYELL